MNIRYYSQSTGCCYLSELHTDIPEDAVEISEEIYETVIANPQPGKVRGHDAAGLPVLVDESWPPLNASALVDAERDRRIDVGIEFQGVVFQGRATDRENITGAAQLAFMAVVGGAKAGDLRWSDPDQDFTWIATDNSLVPMDAPTVVEFGKVAAARKQSFIYAGRQLKDMEVIPRDFADDKWWP